MTRRDRVASQKERTVFSTTEPRAGVVQPAQVRYFTVATLWR